MTTTAIAPSTQVFDYVSHAYGVVVRLLDDGLTYLVRIPGRPDFALRLASELGTNPEG